MSTSVHEIPASQMLLGQPAIPFRVALVESIRTLVPDSHEVSEAHLAMCFLPGWMPTPQMGLFVVAASSAERMRVCQALSFQVEASMTSDERCTVIPVLADDPVLASVRDVGAALKSPH
jgi:hypothetical protein